MWQEENQNLVIGKLSEILSATDKTYAEQLTALFDQAGRIFISGAGRSRLVGSFLGMRLMHCGYDVAMVGEIVTPSIQAKYHMMLSFFQYKEWLLSRICCSLSRPNILM